jgi:hypothetical protein
MFYDESHPRFAQRLGSRVVPNIPGLSCRQPIEFCVTAHNQVMPHSAFQGQTPDEVLFVSDFDRPSFRTLRGKRARDRPDE